MDFLIIWPYFMFKILGEVGVKLKLIILGPLTFYQISILIFQLLTSELLILYNAYNLTLFWNWCCPLQYEVIMSFDIELYYLRGSIKASLLQ